MWEHSSPGAEQLKKLSDAIRCDSQYFENSYVVPSEKRAIRQFHRKMHSQYLIALLSERIPRVAPQDSEWLNILRLWVLTHAIERALHENYRDSAIHSVSTQLRMALDEHGQWRNLFLSLHSRQSRKFAATDFDILSRFISQAARELLDKHLHPGVTSTQRAFLHDLIKVANRVHVVDVSTDDSDYAYIPLRIFSPAASATRLASAGGTIGGDDNEDLEDTEYATAEDGDGTNVFGHKNDNELSYTLQKIKGTGLHIYCVEELQYLPFTWNKINPGELRRIQEWISASLKSDSQDLRFIASVVWLATNFGRSLKQTLNISISSGPVESKWCLNPDSFTLERIPPRRVPGWHPVTIEEAEWVAEDAKIQSIELPEIIASTFKSQLGLHADAKFVGELWSKSWGDSPLELFAKEFQQIAPRVTGGMLANSLPQQTFEKTSDHTFARLLASHPNTALPGACSYCSWPTAKISGVLGGAATIRLADKVGADNSSTDNAMGGLLDPIESMVVGAIRTATTKVERLRRENDVVAFHNAYTAYLVAAMLAGSGGRPIIDPFESYFHFDFDQKFVYVSDKDSGSPREARIVSLPDNLCGMIAGDYLAHLKLLANLIAGINPELSDRVRCLTSRNAPAKMPFFFLLAKNARSWKSVSESEIAALDLFEWPLPLNHFRHRLPRLLRRTGVDTELIDSIFGHAESGSLTHGDYSFRAWSEDMDKIRPVLGDAFDALGFMNIAGWAGASPGISVAGNPGDQSMGDREFGAQARESRRKERARVVIRGANMQIRQFLGDGKKLTDLTEGEIDRLSREMLFNSKGLPHTNGYLKYRVLLKRIEQEWKKSGKKVKLSKRYSKLSEEPAPFDKYASGAMAVFGSMRAACKDIADTQTPTIGTGDCATIFATLLCLENRVSNKRLLDHVLSRGNIRLVTLKQMPHLEYAEKFEDLVGDIPVNQFALSGRAASYLDRICSGEHKTELATLPPALSPIASILDVAGLLPPGTGAKDLIHAIAGVVDQANAISLPGILAGYLGGRVESYSLAWQDRARLELGYPIQVRKNDEGCGKEEKDNKLRSLISASTAISSCGEAAPPELQHHAMAFIGEVRGHLTGCESSLGKSPTSSARRDLSRKIQDSIEKYDGKVSPALALLAKWVQFILFRKVKKDLLDISSIVRYLNALSGSFEEAAYSADMLGMDDEDITILYGNLILSSKARNTQYVARRLIEFHRWARREFGVEDPDWAELPEVFSTANVSPGVITEAEYQSALRLLVHIEEKNHRLLLAAPMMLLLCYRFALRSGEARGLLRSDLVIAENSITALVQNNRFRQLKTPPSRRQVPLLFKLSEPEMSLLKRWADEAASMHGNDMNQPLFSDSKTDDGLMDIKNIREWVIAALRLVTSNNDIVLHHARHSCANFVAVALAGQNLPLWDDASAPCGGTGVAGIETVLLGKTGDTRRKMWAIARYLGHSRRETTCGYYLHFLGSWADTYNIYIGRNAPMPKFMNAFGLDDLPRAPEIKTRLLELIKPKQASPNTTQILKLLRLVARGRAIPDAADSLGIGESHAMALKAVLEMIGARLRLCNAKHEAGKNGTTPYLILLRKLKEPAWNRLIEFSEAMGKKPPESVSVGNAENIGEMIGANGQILLWEEKQFSLLAAFLKHFEIENGDFRFVRSEKMTPELDKLASRYGLVSIRASGTGTKGFQLDVICTGRGSLEVVIESRYAFAYKKNDCRQMRNSYDFMVAFIAFSLACMIAGEQH